MSDFLQWLHLGMRINLNPSLTSKTMEDLVPRGLPNSAVASPPLAYQTLDTLHILHVLEPVSWSLCLLHSLWSSCHSDHRSFRSEHLTDLPWLFNLKMPLT